LINEVQSERLTKREAQIMKLVVARSLLGAPARPY